MCDSQSKAIFVTLFQLLELLIAAFSNRNTFTSTLSIDVIVSAVKGLCATPDVSFHPLIYDLTINLSNKRVMGSVEVPAGFEQSGPSPESLLPNNKCNGATDPAGKNISAQQKTVLSNIKTLRFRQ